MGSDKEFSFGQRVALWAVPKLTALLLAIIGTTLRFEVIAEEGAVPEKPPTTGIFCFWHRCTLLSGWYFRKFRCSILISRSFDGELIARTVELLGFTAIRGSSTRGGVAGLRNMERAYREGHRCAITADGPKGPVLVAKPGTAQLAQLVGADVGTFYVLPERAWQLRSWDRFLIPKPFSRVVITWPAHVPATEVTEATIQAALDRSVEMATE